MALGNLNFTFPMASCLPTATKGGFPHGIPCDHSKDKYLLGNYYVPGAREMAVSKADREPTFMELTGQQGRRALLSCDKCYFLCVESGKAFLRMLMLKLRPEVGVGWDGRAFKAEGRTYGKT